MFRTERQKQLSHFVAELWNLVFDKCRNYPNLTHAEMEYVYTALVSHLMTEVRNWTYGDLRKGE